MYKMVNGRKTNEEGFQCSTYTPTFLKKCVAVKRTTDAVMVRDTKDTGNTTLTFSTGEWNSFIKGVKDGEFDL